MCLFWYWISNSQKVLNLLIFFHIHKCFTNSQMRCTIVINKKIIKEVTNGTPGEVVPLLSIKKSYLWRTPRWCAIAMPFPPLSLSQSPPCQIKSLARRHPRASTAAAAPKHPPPPPPAPTNYPPAPPLPLLPTSHHPPLDRKPLPSSPRIVRFLPELGFQRRRRPCVAANLVHLALRRTSLEPAEALYFPRRQEQPSPPSPPSKGEDPNYNVSLKIWVKLENWSCGCSCSSTGLEIWSRSGTKQPAFSVLLQQLQKVFALPCYWI